MTSRLMAEAYGSALRKLSSSLKTARKSSVVVVAIKLACAGVVHEARGALSGLSRAAAWPLRAGATFGTHEGRHARVLFSRLNHFSRECPYDWCNEPVTVRIPCSAFVIKSVLSDSHNPQALPQAHSELRGVMYTAHVRTAAGCRGQRAGGAAHRVRGRGPPRAVFTFFVDRFVRGSLSRPEHTGDTAGVEKIKSR